MRLTFIGGPLDGEVVEHDPDAYLDEGWTNEWYAEVPGIAWADLHALRLRDTRVRYVQRYIREDGTHVLSLDHRDLEDFARKIYLAELITTERFEEMLGWLQAEDSPDSTENA